MEKQVSSAVVQSPDGRPPKDGEVAPHCCFCLTACLLTLLSIGVIIYIRVVIHEQNVNLNYLKAENQQLIRKTSILEKEVDSLNRTLAGIMKFKNFPVDQYCPQGKCQPCQSDWIQFQEKCYLVSNEPPPWKTWTEGRQYCQNTAADLVVIDNPQEQEFVSNLTKFYYDRRHGYWLGLTQNADKNWVWADGRNDTLKYWMLEPLGPSGLCALMLPNRNFTANWNQADCMAQHKFICESETLIWSN